MSIKIDNNKIIFTRTFNTSAEKLFNAYTDEQLFKAWFHPEGASTEIFKFNVQDGGDAFLRFIHLKVQVIRLLNTRK